MVFLTAKVRGKEYRRYIATVEVLLSRLESWTCSLKLSFRCLLRKLLVVNLRATVGSKDSSSYVEEEMEADIPGKTNSYLHCVFGGGGGGGGE